MIETVSTNLPLRPGRPALPSSGSHHPGQELTPHQAADGLGVVQVLISRGADVRRSVAAAGLRPRPPRPPDGARPPALDQARSAAPAAPSATTEASGGTIWWTRPAGPVAGRGDPAVGGGPPPAALGTVATLGASPTSARSPAKNSATAQTVADTDSARPPPGKMRLHRRPPAHLLATPSTVSRPTPSRRCRVDAGSMTAAGERGPLMAATPLSPAAPARRARVEVFSAPGVVVVDLLALPDHHPASTIGYPRPRSPRR